MGVSELPDSTLCGPAPGDSWAGPVTGPWRWFSLTSVVLRLTASGSTVLFFPAAAQVQPQVVGLGPGLPHLPSVQGALSSTPNLRSGERPAAAPGPVTPSGAAGARRHSHNYRCLKGLVVEDTVTSHQASPSKQRKQPSTYQKRLLFFTIKVLQSPERHRDAGSRESRGSREPAPSRDLKAPFLWESVGPLPAQARGWRREPLGAGPRCAHASRLAPGRRCFRPQSRTGRRGVTGQGVAHSPCKEPTPLQFVGNGGPRSVRRG